jgi:hypothetical protein
MSGSPKRGTLSRVKIPTDFPSNSWLGGRFAHDRGCTDRLLPGAPAEPYGHVPTEVPSTRATSEPLLVRTTKSTISEMPNLDGRFAEVGCCPFDRCPPFPGDQTDGS